MDTAYIGKYGQLRVLGTVFLDSGFIDQLSQKKGDEFVKQLSATNYSKEIDGLSGFYKGTDLIEAVINAHMMSSMQNVLFAVPSSALPFVNAYISRFDIENIKLIISSKKLGYRVEQTEAFLVIGRGVPAGLLGAIITKEDYKNILEQSDIEGVVKNLVKYGYGVTLMKSMDDVKKDNDISGMILSLDLLYYDRLIEAYRMHNSPEGQVLNYMRDSIDIRNLMSSIKASVMHYKDVKSYFIKGGNIPEGTLSELAEKDIYEIKDYSPFKIDYAFDLYRKDPFLSYIEVALKKELYKKYLGIFRRSGFSLGFLLAFMMRAEIERDELRNAWLKNYYGLSNERFSHMKILDYII